MPGLSPDRRLAAATASLERKFIQYGKENTGWGYGSFSLGCFLPAWTREIPGARDAEQ